MVIYRTDSGRIKVGDLWSKVKVTITLYSNILHNSLLISLPRISALLCPIKMKFGMSIRYALGRFAFEFDKENRLGNDVIVTSFDISPNNCMYLNFF